MSRPVALVTGASSGIGRELARLLAEEGHDLVVCARRAHALAELAGTLRGRHGIECAVVPADLADVDGPGRLVEAVGDLGIDVDVLVNNAGAGRQGPLHEEDLDAVMAMVRLNMDAVTELTHRLVAPMVARGRGAVLNVASTAAFQPGPGMAVYYASKAYVLSLSEALHQELRDTGVSVTCLCPGPTRTGFQEAADMQRVRLAQMAMADAADVARAGYEGMRRGKRVVIPGLRNRIGSRLVGWLPRGLVLRVVQRLNSA